MTRNGESAKRYDDESGSPLRTLIRSIDTPTSSEKAARQSSVASYSIWKLHQRLSRIRDWMSQRLTLHVSTVLAFGPIGIIWAFLPIHLRSLGASYFLIALVSLIPAIETIGLSPAWGGILDKTGRGNKILFVSLLVQGVGFSVFPFLKNPGEFVLVVSLMGLFSSSFIPVYGAMATLSNRQYGRAIGGFWTAALLGYATATLIGGILYQYESVNSLFFLGAIYGYAGTLVVLLAPKDGLILKRSLDISRGYWGLLKQRNIAILCLLSITVLVSTSAFNSFFTVYLVDVLNGSRLTAGLAATGTTVLGVFAYRIVGPLNDKVGRKPVFMLGAAGYAAYFTILYFVTNVVGFPVLLILPIYALR